LNLEDHRVLVAGGAGFIGSHLVDRLIKEKPKRLIVVDNFCFGDGKIKNLDTAKKSYPSLKIVRADASKYSLMKQVLKNESIDVVFDLAVVCLPASLVYPRATFDVNCSIASVFCELLRKDCYQVLIHFSSSEVYGDATEVPMNENHSLKPSTPYAASKIAADHLILSYVKTFGVESSIVRPFNVMGPRQNAGTYAGVIPATVQRILSRESPVIDGDGFQTRDYTYVTDVADAAVRVYCVKATRGKVLNIASGKEVKIKDLVTRIAQLMNCTSPIVHGDPRQGDVQRFVGSNALAKELIDYVPKVSFDEGLTKTVDWYVKESKK